MRRGRRWRCKGAGFVDLAHQRVLIQTPVPAPDPAAIARAVLAVRGNTPITIGDVATVTEAPALKSGDALIQGKPGVLLSLASQYGANTLETTRARGSGAGAADAGAEGAGHHGLSPGCTGPPISSSRRCPRWNSRW